MEKMKQYLLLYPRRNAVIFLLLGFLFLGIGTYVPQVITQVASTQSATSIESANQKFELATEKMADVEKWCNPSLLVSAKIVLGEAEALLEGQEGAVSFETQAQQSGNISFFNKAAGVAHNSQSLSEAVIATLNGIEQGRIQAQKDYDDLAIRNDKDVGLISGITQRVTQEGALYLTSYSQELESAKANIYVNWYTANEHLKSALGVLPEPTSTCACGDPDKAKSHITQAQEKLSCAEADITALTQRLDILLEAKQSAVSKTEDARDKYHVAEAYIVDKKAQTGFWLNDASSELQLALNSLTLAENTTGNKREGNKIDYLVAYQAAGESLRLSSSSEGIADREIQLARSLDQSLVSLENLGSEVNSLLDEADSAYLTLSSYHNSYAWDDAPYTNANALYASAETHYQNAVAYSDMKVQKFIAAQSEVDAGRADLEESKRLAQGFIDQAVTLEVYRMSWGDAYDDADNNIDQETDLISRYGSYDSSAKSDYDRAIRLLDEAETAASEGYYQEAVDKANEAERVVEGSGSEAKDAFDEEEEEKEERRRRASSPSITFGGDSDSDFGSGYGDSSSYGSGYSDSSDSYGSGDGGFFEDSSGSDGGFFDD